MANNVNIKIKFPTLKSLRDDLGTILGKLEDSSEIKLKFDTMNLSKDLSTLANAIKEIKKQTGSLKIVSDIEKKKVSDLSGELGGMAEDVNALTDEFGKLTNTFDGDNKLKKSVEETRVGIGETVKEVSALKQEFDENGDVVYESFEKVNTIITKNIDKVKELKASLSSKISGIKEVNYATEIDEKVINALQKRVDLLSTNTLVSEFNDLGKTIADLGNSSKSILKLQNQITQYEEKVLSLKNNFKSIVPEKELTDTINKIGGIKAVISDLQNGGNYNNDEINTFVKNLTNSFTRLSNETKKINSEGQVIEKITNVIAKYDEKVSSLKGKFKEIVPENELADVIAKIGRLQAILTELQNGGSYDDAKLTTYINELVNGFTTLDNKTKQINSENISFKKTEADVIKLDYTIQKHLLTLKNLEEGYKDCVNPDDFKEANVSVLELQALLNKLMTTGADKNEINKALKDTDLSMKKVTTSTNKAYKAQQEYKKGLTSFGGALSSVAKKVGIFSLVYTGLSKIKSEFSEGIQSVIDMDTALTDLNKVVSLSKTQLVEMRDASVSMGQALGRSAVDVAKAQAEFGRMYKDTQVINDLVKTSIIGANTMGDINSDEVAKGLTTIMSALKLEATDAMKVIDSLNEIQNNYKISSKDLLSGLEEVGSVANVAGASIHDLNGYMTAMQIATGKAGNELGTSLNSIMSRLYRVGAGGIDSDGKSEKALSSIGVAVRNLEGDFRPVNDILSDLNEKWGDLTQTQKIFTSQQIANTTQFNEFIALMDNFDTAMEATAVSINSVGSATQENELYIASIEGRMASLKAKTQGFWFNFIDSDAIKNGISLLSGLVSVLDATQNKIGSLGMTAGVLTTAFLTFTNNPLRAFSKGFLGLDKVMDSVIDTSGVAKTTTEALGTSMTTAKTKTTALSAGLKAMDIQMFATKLGAIALQTVLSLGLGFAISIAVSALSSLVSSFKSTEERVSSLRDKTKDLSESLNDVSVKTSLLDNYRSINEELSSANVSQERSIELNKELLSLKEEIAGDDSQAYFILNSTKAYEDQIQAIKELNNEKIKSEAIKLDKDLGNGFFGADENTKVKEAIERITVYTTKYRELTELAEKSEDGITNWYGISMNVDERTEELARLKDEINSGIKVIDAYGNAIDFINKSGVETSRTKKQLTEDVSKYVDEVINATDALNENTEAQSKNNQSGQDEIYSPSKDYAESFNETLKFIDELNAKIETLNENNAMTTDLMDFLIDKYGDAYPELMANLTDTAYVQEFLNNKIKEQEDIANTTYQNLIANNEKYYKEKLLNDAEFVKEYRQSLISMGMSSEKAYALDLSSFNTLQELKTYTMGEFQQGVGEWLSSYIDITADGYNIDLNNFTDVASAKLVVLKALNEEVKKVTRNLEQAQKGKAWADTQLTLFPSGSVKGKFANAQLEQSLSDMDKYQNKLNDLQGAIEEVDTKLVVPKLDLSKYLPNNTLTSGTKDKDGGDKDKSSEKEIANIELKKDAYYELNSALKDVENQLAKNKSLEKVIGEEKYLENEIRLLNQKLKIEEQIRKKELEETNSLKKKLQSSFKFDAKGFIKDYDKAVSSIEAWANNSSGEEKERRKTQASKIIEDATRYMNLLNDSIPDLDKSIIDTSNDISEAITRQTEIKVDKILENIDKLEDEIDKRLSDIDFEQKISGKTTIGDNITFDTKRLDLAKEKLAFLSKEHSNLTKVVAKTTDGQELLAQALGEVTKKIQEEKLEVLELTQGIEKFRVENAIEDIHKLEKIADDKLNSINKKQQYYAGYSYDDNLKFEASKLDTSKNKLQRLTEEYGKLKSMTLETVEGKKALAEAIEDVESKIDSEKTSILSLTQGLEKLKIEQLSSLYDDKVWQKGTQQNNKIDLELQVIDDDDVVNKITLMNKQLEINKSMVGDTKKYIQDLRNTNVTTAEGYGELVRALMNAEEKLHSQESSVISLDKSMNDLVETTMKKYIEQLKEIEKAQMEVKHKNELTNLDNDFFRTSSAEWNKYQRDKLISIAEEISLIQDKLYLDRDNLALMNLLKAKQDELFKAENVSYDSITDWYDVTNSMYEDRIKSISDEIDALKSKKSEEDEIADRLAKQNELIELQNKLNDIKNNKNIRELQKGEDGSWGFSYTYDKEEYQSTQDAYKSKQEELTKWEKDLEYNKHLEALERQKEFYQKTLEELKRLYEEEKKLLVEEQELEKKLNEEKYESMIDNLSDYVAEMLEKFGGDLPEAMNSLMDEVTKGKSFIDSLDTSLSELFDDSILREAQSQDMVNLFSLKYGQLLEGSKQFFGNQSDIRLEANNKELNSLNIQNELVQTSTKRHLVTLGELYKLGWDSIMTEMNLQLEIGYTAISNLYDKIESRTEATLNAISRLRQALAELNSLNSEVASARALADSNSSLSVPSGDVTTNARSINIANVSFPHASSANSIESALRNIDTKAVQYAERR